MQHKVICTASKSHQKLNWIYSSADTNSVLISNRTWRSDASPQNWIWNSIQPCLPRNSVIWKRKIFKAYFTMNLLSEEEKKLSRPISPCNASHFKNEVLYKSWFWSWWGFGYFTPLLRCLNKWVEIGVDWLIEMKKLEEWVVKIESNWNLKMKWNFTLPRKFQFPQESTMEGPNHETTTIPNCELNSGRPNEKSSPTLPQMKGVEYWNRANWE